MSRVNQEQDQILTNPSISVNQTAGVTEMVIWVDQEHQEALRIRLDPGAALGLAGSIVSQAAYAAQDAASQIALGDCSTCSTCSNTRLVEVEKRPGRIERVHCPDCNPDGTASRGGFPAFPRIGGGVR